MARAASRWNALLPLGFENRNGFRADPRQHLSSWRWFRVVSGRRGRAAGTDRGVECSPRRPTEDNHCAGLSLHDHLGPEKTERLKLAAQAGLSRVTTFVRIGVT